MRIFAQISLIILIILGVLVGSFFLYLNIKGYQWTQSGHSRLTATELFVEDFVFAVMKHDANVFDLIADEEEKSELSEWFLISVPNHCLSWTEGFSGRTEKDGLYSLRIECNSTTYPFDYVQIDIVNIQLEETESNSFQVKSWKSIVTYPQCLAESNCSR